MEERGYDISGSGVIKCEGQIIGRIEQISVHIYPEEIFLEIEKTPATAPLMRTLLDPNVPELEIVTEVGEFCYIAKGAKVNKVTVEGEKSKTILLTGIEMTPLEIEKVPKWDHLYLS